ncbi:MAG: hypothetical protein GXO21_07445, partial [Aquificae bacterium]|nr:hypothetical protein [Aquificota bacterium]
MRKFLFFALFFLILSSCKNMYSKVFDKEEAKQIYCLNVKGNDMFLNTKVEKYLKEYGFRLEKNCPYRLEVFALKLSQCNSPKGKSLGADFDGYVRFSVYKGNKLIYRCQEDYKGEFGDY